MRRLREIAVHLLGALASGELVAPFKRSADPARAYYAIVSRNAAGRPEVADFVNWLHEEAKKEPR